ncbi:LamG domain-containing protein [Candidatus Nanosalina sp. VS9-1]|uniref:LamG domain-containing protein n=1 Tax=Candidatus Nanosalina sp. VS9-1 TaxID=3388566 RepID=UPI0039DF3A11
MAIRWDSESDWEDNQDSSGTVGRNGDLKQGYSRERPDLSSGLVGYWPLHDDSATDYSGNKNHGTLNGGVTTGVSGRGGLQAMSFDGSDDYVGVSDDSVFTVSSFTVSAWVKIDSQGEYGIISNYNGSGSSQHYGIRYGSNNSGDGSYRVNIYYDDGGASGYSFTILYGDTDIADGNWHLVTGVWDGSTGETTLYVDGNIENSSTGEYTGTLNPSSGPRIGDDTAGSHSNFDGNICQARIYNRALSQSEIQELYKWGSGDYARPPNQNEGGVSYWPLDGDVNDSWGSNDGTNNGASFVSNSIRHEAAKFDGGEEDSVAIPDNTVTNNNSWTVSTWVNLNSIPNSGSYYVTSQFRVNGQWWMRVRDDRKWEFGWYDGSPKIALTESTLIKNDWYHLVARWNPSGNATVYVNGVQEDSKATTTTDTGDMSQSSIGADRRYSQFYMDGILDEFRIYNRALKPHEIFELYRYGTRGRDMRKQLVKH